MKRYGYLVVLIAILAFPVVALADGIDPQMRVDPIQGPAPFFCEDPVTHAAVRGVFVTSPFSFSATAQGFYCFVRNDSGFVWKSLDIGLGGLSLKFTPEEIQCSTDSVLFASFCIKRTDNEGFVTNLIFTAPGDFPGISGQNTIFGIDIRPHNVPCTPSETNGPFCWGTGDFTATGLAEVVPEPASALLLVSGVAALLGKRRRWFHRS